MTHIEQFNRTAPKRRLTGFQSNSTRSAHMLRLIPILAWLRALETGSSDRQTVDQGNKFASGLQSVYGSWILYARFGYTAHNYFKLQEFLLGQVVFFVIELADIKGTQVT